ncbi:siderophore biosynthesis protein [Tatlockia micdadei]|uniref:IucA/IucC family protein n=1 Tax=Legionella micdadei TaxID=451 RepID=UPI0015701D7C|nr:IucA/IucC family protein [Legionella micdadei]NSL18073.1 siderophore biosynthesis protein [Legionella micdadei]
MALACDDFHGLNHQLRFLLFEMGIGLTQHSIDYFIHLIHRQCLQRLQQTAVIEGLTNTFIPSHHVHDFLAQLKLQLKQENPASIFFDWQVLQKEINEAIANEAMAQAYRQRWQIELKRQVGENKSFWAWLCEENDSHESNHLLEQWGCINLSPYPGFKAKLAFSRREVLQYSAEFGTQMNLHWCAMHKNIADAFYLSESYEELISQQFPKEYRLWQEKLYFKQQNPENYYPIPVHPWQWRNQIQKPFSPLLDHDRLILFPHHQSVKPTSLASIMMPEDKGACYMALSLASEQVSIATTLSDIQKSQWLNNLLQKHHDCRNLYIGRDLAGLSVMDKSIPARLQKQLAVTLHENPTQRLSQRQRIIPLTALFANSPISDRPLLLEIIQASGLNPESYFHQYCQMLLESQLFLLFHCGIALATSPQGLLILFDDNKPTALLLRKLEDIYICTQPAYPEHAAPCTPANLSQIRYQFIQTNLQNNLSFWISCLNRYYGISPKKLWRIVANTIEINLAQVAPVINPQVFAWQYSQLMLAPWQYVCALTMKLHRSQRRIHRLIPNLLKR